MLETQQLKERTLDSQIGQYNSSKRVVHCFSVRRTSTLRYIHQEWFLHFYKAQKRVKIPHGSENFLRRPKEMTV
jgi:hypothetical protein